MKKGLALFAVFVFGAVFSGTALANRMALEKSGDVPRYSEWNFVRRLTTDINRWGWARGVKDSVALRFEGQRGDGEPAVPMSQKLTRSDEFSPTIATLSPSLPLGADLFNLSPSANVATNLAEGWHFDGMTDWGWQIGTTMSSRSRLDAHVIAETVLDPAYNPPLDPPVDNSDSTPVPEPGIILFFGLGLGSLVAFRREFGGFLTMR